MVLSSIACDVDAGGPGFALALGGGGARGLAHILALEAFDELGVKPRRIAGTSIGAIYGAAFASGMTAKVIRAHTEETLGQRLDLMRQIFAARTPAALLLSLVPFRPALLDPNVLLDALLPSGVPQTFEALRIPLQTVACDFYAQTEVIHSSGDLRSAIAASMALPVIFAPVMRNGRALVDGGFVNPLPFDVFAGVSETSANREFTVAIDVSGAVPGSLPEGVQHTATAASQQPATAPTSPSAMTVLAASSQILQRSIVREKLRSRQPDILIECPVDAFSVIDFHKWREILTASAPIKDMLKRRLDSILQTGGRQD